MTRQLDSASPILGNVTIHQFAEGEEVDDALVLISSSLEPSVDADHVLRPLWESLTRAFHLPRKTDDLDFFAKELPHESHVLRRVREQQVLIAGNAIASDASSHHKASPSSQSRAAITAASR